MTTAIQQGRLAPLYGGTPRNLSPSPTLLVESHRAGPADSGTRLIPGQVLSAFLEPVGVRHSAEGFPSSRIGSPANSTVISMRGRTESVVWLGPAQILAVRIFKPPRRPRATWSSPRRVARGVIELT